MIENKPPPKIDVKNAAQSSLRVEGADLLLNFKRLRQEAQGSIEGKLLQWQARFDLCSDQAGHQIPWLHLILVTALPKTCQRCLGPVDVPINVDRKFRFVDNEAIAEQQDDESEEDVLVIGREFDLLALIEDEILLDLPLVARHDTCPVTVNLVAMDADFDEQTAKPKPFAVLEQLKDKVSAHKG